MFLKDQFVATTDRLGFVLSTTGPNVNYPIVVRFPYYNGFGHENMELEYTLAGCRQTAMGLEYIRIANAEQIVRGFREAPEYWLGDGFGPRKYRSKRTAKTEEFKFTKEVVNEMLITTFRDNITMHGLGLDMEELVKVILIRREIIHQIEKRLNSLENATETAP